MVLRCAAVTTKAYIIGMGKGHNLKSLFLLAEAYAQHMRFAWGGPLQADVRGNRVQAHVDHVPGSGVGRGL